ncbi:Sulfide:quinone oxidoreductase, mitochondrial [Nymphon striatum]|nr:Sulfide:quinone oxidoreductase, mitochondrial [Nymphon striatum]
MAVLKDNGFRSIICNRPDGEGADQPTFEELEKVATDLGLEARYIPIVAGKVSDEDTQAFGAALAELPSPTLAYCRTGTRSATLWSLDQADKLSVADILAATKAAGYDMGGVVRRIANGGKTPTDRADASYDVVVVGGGAAGIAVSASLRSRQPDLEIAVIDPADIHYYQPGWTMVGGGIFEAQDTAKTMGSLIPKGVHWIKSAVAAFEPKDNAVILDGCRVIQYKRLVFNNAGGVLFGVKDYVPALEEYVKKYDATLNFFHNLVAVDGASKKAWFDVAKPDTPTERVEMEFDMMHVCPPQTAPDFIRVSPLADAAGWVDVDQATLRHKTYDNVWSLGDVMNAPNAKTAAAARLQAPIVAENIIADTLGKSPVAQYNGYGSCPLTVERGKIVLAEFGYGGTLLPSFPKFLIDGTKPSRAAWLLKEKILPPVYWKAMLRGHEWMAKPEKVTVN